MSIAVQLLSYKAWQLRYACFLAGLPTSGTKTELAHVLEGSLLQPEPRRRNRVLSVDMGIRNLGTCVIDSSDSDSKDNGVIRAQVVAWKKFDLLTEVNPDQVAAEAKSANFSPSSLASIASKLTGNWLQACRPDQILIERQRFRSGGASAVQEWTLRVNMLESMLWASLRTRQDSINPASHFPDLEEVSPARVAGYWCWTHSDSVRRVYDDLFDHRSGREALWSQVQKKKVEKKDKIAVVQSWLASSNEQMEVRLDFTDETRTIAQAFTKERKLGSRSTSKQTGPEIDGIGKLDDLADCLLQAVTWLKWTQNRNAIRRILAIS